MSNVNAANSNRVVHVPHEASIDFVVSFLYSMRNKREERGPRAMDNAVWIAATQIPPVDGYVQVPIRASRRSIL